MADKHWGFMSGTYHSVGVFYDAGVAPPPGREEAYAVASFEFPAFFGGGQDGQKFHWNIDEHNLEDFPDVCSVESSAPQVYRVERRACVAAVRVSRCSHHADSDRFVVQVTTARGTFELCRVATEEWARHIADLCVPCGALVRGAPLRR